MNQRHTMRLGVLSSRSAVAFAIALGLLATSVRAQPGEANSPRQQVVRGFERTAPDVGELLPDVAAFDADGQPLRLSSLKGSHTVLVFGCLT
ncbi:MAG TPA: hypothetical protein VML55_20830 [Planctomycetaceae bacterium]|nr:hypothetical protein [Planctomycetaceae bacterium]